MPAMPLFPTSVVGSMPRPAWVRRLISDDLSMDDSDRARWMDAAIGSVIALQEAAGLDVITDGEWGRKSYIGVIAELADGFELSTASDGRPWTVVTEKLTPRQPGHIAAEVVRTKRLTDRAIKSTLPAPALLGERMWDPVASAAAYPTRESFVEACVPILRREVELLRDEGVSIVQIDDPHLCLFVDPEVRAGYDNPDRAADFAAEMTNQVVDGIEGVRLAVHLCRRAGARVRGEHAHEGGYGPIIGPLNRLKVHHLTMEFTAPQAGDMEVFGELREDFEIGLGCVGCQPGRVDMADEIVERVEMALKHIDPARVTLNPDCGFAPGSAADVSLDEVYTKLCHEVEAARRLRDRYGS
jgi:5-methyltetrahydropteroyltriglutamate--homocysteine methyltransferase